MDWTISAREWLRAARTPGPRGALRPLLAANRDFLGFLSDCHRRYGEVFRFRYAHLPLYVFTDPDAIHEVLVARSGEFIKDWPTRSLRVVMGEGLITSEGAAWKRHRKIAAPAFRRSQIASHAETMVWYARRYVDRLRDGEVRDMHADMMSLTCEIVVRTLFGLEFDRDNDGRRVAEAIGALTDAYSGGGYGLLSLLLSNWLPLPRQLSRTLDELHRMVDGIIAERRARMDAADGDDNDLLGILMRARYDDGTSLSPEALRGECMTLFLAGHETTALALSFVWWLLGRHPEAMTRVRAEVAEVVGERPVSVADIPRLAYTDAVVRESMRLYPPVWAIGREAVTATEVAGVQVPKGAQLWFAQWLNHRDGRFFPEPERFVPERWLDGLAERLPRFAYYPFGGGPRVCIGNHFSMMEAVLILATIAAEIRVQPLPGSQKLELDPAITLRPRGGIRMRIARCE